MMDENEKKKIEELIEKNAFQAAATALAKYSNLHDLNAIYLQGLLYRSNGFADYNLEASEQCYRLVAQFDVRLGFHGLTQIGKILILNGQFKSGTKLLEEAFDRSDIEVANLLGFCFSRKENGILDFAKAKQYYEVSANAGDPHGLQGLAWLLKLEGKEDDAFKVLLRSSESGSAEASYLAYKQFLKIGDLSRAKRYLVISAEQKHAIGIQKYAIQRAIGKFGVHAIVPGIVSYFSNVPNLYRYFSNKSRNFD
jgi:Flp pilus assembly protein TadD